MFLRILVGIYLLHICKGLVIGGGENQCPDPGEIFPCVCIVEELDVNFDCSSVVSETQLKSIFAKPFPESDAKKLTIKDNSLLSALHSGVFGTTEFVEVDITGTAIVTVEADVFESSYSTLTKIKFSNNKIISFPFQDVEKFTNIISLDLTSNVLQDFPEIKSDSLKDFFIGANLITTIPAGGLQKVPKLERFRAGRNSIPTIAKGTFTSLQYLREVDYTMNSLPYILKDTFVFNGNVTSLYLSHNAIEKVDVGAFKGITNEVNVASNFLVEFVEEVWRPLLEDEARLAIEDNPLKCECDIAWLVRNETLMEHVYKGATCESGYLIHELDPEDYDTCP